MEEIKKFPSAGFTAEPGVPWREPRIPSRGENHHTFITGNARCAVLENGNPKSTRCWSMTVTGESP